MLCVVFVGVSALVVLCVVLCVVGVSVLVVVCVVFVGVSVLVVLCDVLCLWVWV